MRVTVSAIGPAEPTLDDSAWSQARAHALVDARERRPLTHGTEVRLLSGTSALWVHFTCRARSVTARMRAYKDKVWTEGAVEVYLKPAGGDHLFEFQCNAIGTRRDLRVELPGEPEQRFDDTWSSPGFATWTRLTSDAAGTLVGWRALLRLPWAELQDRPRQRSPTDWHVGLFRWEYDPLDFSALAYEPHRDAHDQRFLGLLTVEQSSSIVGTAPGQGGPIGSRRTR